MTKLRTTLTSLISAALLIGSAALAKTPTVSLPFRETVGVGSDSVAAEAERIVSNVRVTHYQHDEVVDESVGVYDLDCSEFVSDILQHAAPAQYTEVPKESDEPDPRAFKYYEFFASLSTTPASGWQVVDRFADATRGDILVWRTPEARKHHDTGHIVILAAAPKQRDDGDWEVDVYDSSEIRHYHDSRVVDGVYNSGVGTGAIRFHVDAAGHPTAFQFGPGDRFHAYSIVIARVVGMPPR